MKVLNEEYAILFSHKNFDICTLKVVCRENGDYAGYIIDDGCFAGRQFDLVDDAVKAIDDYCMKGEM